MGCKACKLTSRTSALHSKYSYRQHVGAPHTSFGDFRKGQAGTSLQVHAIRVDQSGERAEWIAGEKVDLVSLPSYQLAGHTSRTCPKITRSR